MLSKKHKRVLFQILPFGIIPAIFSVVQVLLEKGVLGNHPIYPSTGNPYESNFVIPVITSFSTGILIGIFEELYVNKWFQNRSFFAKIFLKSIVYILAIIMATLIIIISGHSISQGLNPFGQEVSEYVGSFFADFAFWSIIIYYALAILISLFYKEVSDSMGQAVSYNFFTGKYHHPKVEHRIFMFLDMKSSTSHAENLGHVKYFQMLKDYYADLSIPILNLGGEIYQYVGDEIVISWKVKKGNAQHALECFYAMKKALNDEHEKYESKYQMVPSFKAGIHFGKVTTGEIGLIKKDIVFTGDTLNTTARIQSLCNQYEEELLVSEDFLNTMQTRENYHFKSLGEVNLRGRNQGILIFGVSKPEQIINETEYTHA